MFIGLLNAADANLNISYSYKKRGLDIAYYPDLICEKENKNAYNIDGELFSAYIGFNGTVLLDRGIDIHIDLGKTCFVDTISFMQGEESCLGEIKVLVPDGTALKAAGRLSPQSGESIKDERLNIPVGIYTNKLILRLNAVYKHVKIGKLSISGAVDLENTAYPIPNKIKYTGGYIKKIDAVLADGEDEIFAARYFIERLGISHCGIFSNANTSSIVGGGSRSETEGFRYPITFKLSSLCKNAYTISAKNDSILICGADRLALIQAAEKLVQLCGKDGIPCCEIEDTPFMQIRGIHIGLPNRDKIDYFKRVVKYMLAPLGYNNVFIQLSATMEYKSHPEINAAWKEGCEKYRNGEWPLPAHYEFVSSDVLSHEEVRDLCDYIRSFGIEIIPEVQSFGHTQYITMSHPELAELEPKSDEDIDLFTADIKPESFYKHSMCPNHPDYYKLIFDIIDEVIDVIQPEKYLHIGHDEIYTVGKCERCRDIPDDEIYASEVNALNEHIKSRGLTTMMWSDMMQEQNYTTAPAISKVSKDIVCLSFTWYFHLDENVENMLYENGFKVMHGNFYSSHFPRFNERTKHPDFLGAQTSTWVNMNEDILSFKGKIYDIVYDANMFWNSGYAEDHRLCYDILADGFLQRVRPLVSENVIDGKTTGLDFKKDAGALPYDIATDFDSAALLAPGESLRIEYSGKLSKIAFVHSCDIGGDHIVWKNPVPIADYIICYADGSSYSHAIGYGLGIMEYRRRYAMPISSDMYRHEGYIGTGRLTPYRGKTIDGSDYTLYEYTIANPQPQKEISHIMLTHRGSMDANIIIYDIKVQSNKEEL